ncbi:ribosome biogenesis GTP-binding protein YihA/YsxC [Roseivirga pacifica]|uniref:ribosome biogenesis GTP-binding protein YihA/YsxC n=1 Tax=Roseivirga pacifica TaxID=1267423 RepID=UPI002095CF6A|nr:ribosome biogenesis GTP-binding protein YihA/YsxC [Roseivirga pacifica]MCO6357821.1 YihA family ribosome biogenesis GTP-binding protein [Roseivirga pacifica]MCO6366073.1 YihA family ribosome biogenesis GTP-binding protein [Roseivirga pacifica]MCO6371401.1 YihA family ribosome biogenesis GTP-binding protein [Roseivirga pacifica]MCO6375427.1 YihA family ribosome biogenesis GTP-binding protein [Roseivirga pacifica]MCO6378779.1 YihA family ribosome biogenesis GTP-binding protein [Roseivirga pac
MFESAAFIISNTDYKKCPKPDLPEFAFIGRSNVGKSSLINMLTDKKNLAKTSGKPGKTQLINHFKIDESWYLVDLPGYGYAKTSKKNREAWEMMISEYLINRENLQLVFVLIDSRLPPQQIDLEFIDWLGENMIPFALIFTKADKQSINKGQQNVAKFRKTMKANWEELPPMFLTSSESKFGKEKVSEYIQEILES